MVDSVQSHSANDGDYTILYHVSPRSEIQLLTQLKKETVGVPGEEVLKQDGSSKLKCKAYANLKRGAIPKSIRVGNTVLLKAEKTNKLSTNFNPDPFKVVHKTGSGVTLRNKKEHCICEEVQ